MNVVDSSAWLEYFANGSNASFFAGPIETTGIGHRGPPRLGRTVT